RGARRAAGRRPGAGPPGRAGRAGAPRPRRPLAPPRGRRRQRPRRDHRGCAVSIRFWLHLLRPTPRTPEPAPEPAPGPLRPLGEGLQAWEPPQPEPEPEPPLRRDSSCIDQPGRRCDSGDALTSLITAFKALERRVEALESTHGDQS